MTDPIAPRRRIRPFFDYVQLRQAVVEGATYGARNPKDTSGVQAEVTSPSVPAGTLVTSSPQMGYYAAGGTGSITVTASPRLTPITPEFLRGW